MECSKKKKKEKKKNHSLVTGNRVWKGLPCKAQWFTTLWLYKEYYYRGSGILHKTDNTHKLLVKIVSYFCLHFTQLHNFFLEPGFIYISSDCKACHIYIFVATTLFRLAVAVTPVQKQTLLLLQYLLGITCWNPSRCQHLLPADSHFFVVIFFFFFFFFFAPCLFTPQLACNNWTCSLSFSAYWFKLWAQQAHTVFSPCSLLCVSVSSIGL